MTQRVLPLLLALAGAFALAWATVAPPAPLPPNTPPGVFSAGRAMADIRVLGQRPHPTGSADNARVRAYLLARLQALGAQTRTQTAAMDANGIATLAGWSHADATAVRLTNVVGVLPGRDRRLPAVLLMAHHDSVWGSPGAADDAAGVAAILETVRALNTNGQPARDLIVLFTDGEELGLEGAKAFFRENPLARHVGSAVNLETRGGGGRALMFETSPGNGALMRLYGQVAHPAANSLSVRLYKALPNNTDMTVALGHGVQGFNIAFVGRAELYHSPLATPERLEQGSLQHMGEQALTLAHGLAYGPGAGAREPDRAFADIYGLGLVSLPVWAGWVILAVSVALLLAGARRAHVGWRGVTGGVLTGLWLLTNGGLLLSAANRLSGSGPGANYYDRLASLPRLEWAAALICIWLLLAAVVRYRRAWVAPAIPLMLGAGLLLIGSAPVPVIAAGLIAAGTAWAHRHIVPVHGGPALAGSQWLGLALLLFVAGTGAQAFAPDASPILLWPLLAVSALICGTLYAGRGTLTPGGVMAVVMTAALVGGWLLGYAHLTFLSIGAVLPAIMALFVLLIATLVWPLMPALSRRQIDIAGVSLLIPALLIMLVVAGSPLAPSVATYSH